MGMSGPAPFYNLQDLHAAQGEPHDPTGDMTQYDMQAQPVPGMIPGDVNAQYAAAGNAWQHANPEPPQMPAPQAAPTPTQPSPMTAPPASPMGPMGPVVTPPPSGDLTATMPDLQTRMQQYVAMTKRVYDGMKQPEYSPEEIQDRPNMLSRILLGVATMGRTEDAWNQRAAQRSQYNMKARQHNAEMEYKAFDEAHKLMQADQSAQLAQANFALSQNRFTLEGLRAHAAENDRWLTNQKRLLDLQRTQQQIDLDTPYGGQSVPSPMPLPAGPASIDRAPAEDGALADEGTATTSTTTTPTSSTTTTTGLTIQPGETPRQFMERRKGEEKMKLDAHKKRLESSNEITQNADLVEAHFTPALDAAIDNVLPDTGGLPGVVQRARGAWNASTYNPMGSGFKNRAATGDPDVATIQSMVTAAIPFIRAVAGGTKGIRLTQTELNLLTEDNLKALSTGSVPKDQAHAIITAMKNVLARARSVANPEGTSTTTTPTISTTSTTGADPIEDILKKHGY